MQNFFVLAAADNDLAKFVFVGIWILVVFGGVILKMLGFSDSNKDGEPKAKNSKPNFGGNAKPTKIDDDMARARRRLQEMIKERNAQRDFFERDLPQDLSPFGGAYEIEPEPYPVIEPEPIKTLSRQAEPRKAMQAKVSEKNASDSAYAQNAFDYNMQLEASQKLLAESEIAFNKVAQKSNAGEIGNVAEMSIDIKAIDIKATEIRDFVHNKTMLKKSIIISEILDKPLSLR